MVKLPSKPAALKIGAVPIASALTALAIRAKIRERLKHQIHS
uniref:Uncharacterized protein n=1 Tax=viral metagenome TaxID=1070528 RepID=A0A6C0C202_9ZZZZ